MTDGGATRAAEELGVLIKATQAVLHQRMDESLRPLGLSVPQYVCLHSLQQAPGLTSSELARRAFVSRQSMNVLLQGLQRRGLVERADRPGPHRERATVLTTAAIPVLARARTEVAAVVERLTAPLDATRLDRLNATLAACRDALSTPEPA